MKIVSRMFVSVACMSTLALGCSKDVSRLELEDKLNYNDRRIISRPTLPLPACVRDYDQLVVLLGGSAFNVTAVVLEDGTTINNGQPVVLMQYKAVPKQEEYSLFRSQFTVHYNVYGYQQSDYMDTWSLGCVYENAGVPPYTNIKKQGKVIRINTGFSWGIAPHVGKRIAYLVIG